jgi:hypothetical protein
MPHVGEFFEAALVDEEPERVDVDAGIIYGLPYLGPESPNTISSRQTKRLYPTEVRKARLAEVNGKPCYLNHAKKGEGRLFEQGIGTWMDGRFNEATNRSVADLHLLKSHPATAMVLERAASKIHRKKFGPSISATGPYRTDNELEIVEDYRLSSVDLVIDPATVGGFFEGKKPVMNFKQL